MIRILELVRIMKYELIVDCLNKTGCTKIREIMAENGYKCNMLNGTLLGDHIGVKNFKNKSFAKEEAKMLLKKHDKIINQITIR